VANDYKPDKDKPPVMDAVLIPYRRSILAIASMKADMAVKHKLMGAKDPYLEWMQLPNGKRRLANAGARHALQPWAVNTKDGRHLHITHAIVGLLMALELHLLEQEQREAKLLPADQDLANVGCQHLCGLVDGHCVDCMTQVLPKQADLEHVLERARVELALQGEHQATPEPRLNALPPDAVCECGHLRAQHLDGIDAAWGACCARQAAPHKRTSSCACKKFQDRDRVRGHYWTGDSCTWFCTCGAGRPDACTCTRASGEHI
jgi:hypothetical protein